MNELTREQILGMDEQQLAEATAVHVMGWHQNGFYWTREKGIVMLTEMWDPAKDMATAWDVEEKIEELCKTTDHLIIQRYMAELWLVVGSEGFKMVHATPEQRCKAALLAVLNL